LNILPDGCHHSSAARSEEDPLTERLRVVYLTEPHIDARFVIEEVGHAHQLTLFDPAAHLGPQFASADAVIDSGGSVGTREMLDAAPKVRLWQIMGSGFEHFDLDYWAARHVAVANCPGSASAPALAERALMFCLMLAQKYAEARANVERGVAYLPAGEELAGKLLGLVGFGASAIAFGRLARNLGMRLAAVDIRPISDDEAAAHGLEWCGSDSDLDHLITLADVLSVHLHLNAETRSIIDGRRLRLLKPGAFLINVARGELVDEPALVSALREGRLGGAGLDVVATEPVDPGSPLLQLPNVVLTPHTAGNTAGTLRRRAEFCAQNLNRLAGGLPLESRLV
jgi:phosphoglycerate dehydrogenase-like enzyme